MISLTFVEEKVPLQIILKVKEPVREEPQVTVGQDVDALVTRMLDCSLLLNQSSQIREWRKQYPVEWLNCFRDQQEQENVSDALCLLLFEMIEVPLAIATKENNGDSILALNGFRKQLKGILVKTLPRDEKIETYLSQGRSAYKAQKKLEQKMHFINLEFQEMMNGYDRSEREVKQSIVLKFNELNGLLTKIAEERQFLSEEMEKQLVSQIEKSNQVEQELKEHLLKAQSLALQIRQEDITSKEILNRGLKILEKGVSK